jgi:hypothetical protein
MTRKPLKSQIETKLRRSRKNVFLRKDFAVLGDYDQVGRAMRELVQDKKLLKLGYGLYAKARINQFTGNAMLAAPGGFNQVTREALKRLNINFQASDAEMAYQRGSTQIPANTQVKISGRFSRAIKTGNFNLEVIPA